MVVIFYLNIDLLLAFIQDVSALQHIQNIFFNMSYMVGYFIVVIVIATKIYPN